MRIAAEGRKFGIYLLVSTQRPQKVHENVISQCDNLVLMRLNSTADAGVRRERLLLRAAGPDRPRHDFRLGEALVAGKISPAPRAAPLRRAPSPRRAAPTSRPPGPVARS